MRNQTGYFKKAKKEEKNQKTGGKGGRKKVRADEIKPLQVTAGRESKCSAIWRKYGYTFVSQPCQLSSCSSCDCMVTACRRRRAGNPNFWRKGGEKK